MHLSISSTAIHSIPMMVIHDNILYSNDHGLSLYWSLLYGCFLFHRGTPKYHDHISMSIFWTYPSYWVSLIFMDVHNVIPYLYWYLVMSYQPLMSNYIPNIYGNLPKKWDVHLYVCTGCQSQSPRLKPKESSRRKWNSVRKGSRRWSRRGGISQHRCWGFVGNWLDRTVAAGFGST